MRKILAALLLPCLPFCLTAQYNFGIGNGNYSGIQGAQINPGITAGSPLQWEANVVSLDVLYDNTFIYTPRGSVPPLGFGSLVKGIINNQHYNTRYDPDNPNKLYQFTLSAEALGPSFRMNIGSGQSIGLTTAVRGYANMRDLPGTTAQNAFAYLMQSDLWNRPLSDHSSRVNGMGWLQYGIDYSAILYDDGTDRLKAGIGLNYLQGIVAAYVKNTDLNYKLTDTANLQFTHSSVDYGRTDYDSYRRIGSYGDLNHGYGFGADLGVVFMHKDDPHSPAPYRYRLGLSVMDIGGIDFDRNAAAFHLQTDTANFSAWRQVHLTSNAAVDRTLSAIFYNGDSTKSQTAGHFKMALPTALSVQADLMVVDDFFLNATIVKGLGHGDNPGVIQPDLYSITPRLEHPLWDASLPLSLIYYGHWRPRIGVAVRIGYFFFGGDAPASSLGLSDIQSADVYAGIRIYGLK